MNIYEWDAFISHASEDKSTIVEPLAVMLQKLGLKIWLDKFEIKIGMSLRRTIENGLIKSKYGVVIFSKAFFSKEWPQKELDALFSLEQEPGSRVLPIWHDITYDEMNTIAPMFSDRYALKTSSGIEYIANILFSRIRGLESQTNFSQKTILSNNANQSIYFINCSNCSNILEVVNPRISEQPLSVIGSDTLVWNQSNWIEIIKVGCKICSKQTFVRLKYANSI